MNYFLFGVYSATICAAAGFICGYIYQEVIVNGN